MFEKLIKIIAKGTDVFLESIPKYENLLIQELKKELSKLETKGGKIVKNEANKKIIASLDSKMLEIMKKIGYQSQVFDLLANFDDIDTELKSIHNRVNKLQIAQSLINEPKQVLIDSTTNALLGNGMDANLTQVVKDSLLLNATIGTSLTDTIEEIENQFRTIPERKGDFYRYSTQIGRDALGQYNGAINQAIKNEFGLDATMYVGSLVEDSRAQCERWVNMEEIPDNELQSEIDWAFENGSGMILGTTTHNFCTNRGGYNCRHIAIPKRSKRKWLK